PPVAIASLTVAQSSVRAGDRTLATATLAAPAPAGGETVFLQVLDQAVLAAPGEVFVNAGATTTHFEGGGPPPTHPIIVRAPAHPSIVRARAGGVWAVAESGVTGLLLAEVVPNVPDRQQWIELYNTTSVPIDLSRYGLTGVATLSGIVPAGECFVVGGPVSSV